MHGGAAGVRSLAASCGRRTRDADLEGVRTAVPESALIFGANESAANEVTALAGGNGYVDFYNGSSGPIDLVVDTFGQYARNSGGDTYATVGPVRVLDTRTTTGGHDGKVAGGSSVTLTVGGTNGVPANAAVAVLNIATTDTTSPGYLTAYAHGASRPITSNSNWPSGRTVSNLALYP